MPKVTEQHTDSRRQQIIDAAYRCFARKGFHQTTMREIVAESGLSPGAIYHYFAGKEDIIEASFIFDYQRSLPAFAHAANEEDPVAAIENLLAFFFAGLETAAAMGADRVNIQGWSEALYNPHLLGPLRDVFHNLRELLAGLVQRAQATGRINPALDAAAVAGLLLSAYLGLYLQKAVEPQTNVAAYREAIVALLQGQFRMSEAERPLPGGAKEVYGDGETDAV